MVGLQAFILPTSCYADDSFQCCMKGFKRVGEVEICPRPCCQGYHEVVEHAPFLDPVVYCKQDESLRPLVVKPTFGSWSPAQQKMNQYKLMAEWRQRNP